MSHITLSRRSLLRLASGIPVKRCDSRIPGLEATNLTGVHADTRAHTSYISNSPFGRRIAFMADQRRDSGGVLALWDRRQEGMPGVLVGIATGPHCRSRRNFVDDSLFQV
jgi:hypothetical protein